MRHNPLALLCVLLLTAPAAAQTTVDDCFGCVLGIWDELELTTTSGSIAVNTPKDVYIGIRFDPAQRFNGLTGIEFSIAGFGSRGRRHLQTHQTHPREWVGWISSGRVAFGAASLSRN